MILGRKVFDRIFVDICRLFMVDGIDLMNIWWLYLFMWDWMNVEE